MADFAVWGCAIAEAAGFGQETFLSAYNASIALQNEEAINASGLATTIVMFMEGQDKWEGSPTKLLGELEGIAMLEKVDMRSRMWPQGAQALLRRLKEVQSNLLKIGIRVSHGHAAKGRRFIALEKIVASDPKDVALTQEPKSIFEQIIDAGEEGQGCDGCDISPDPNVQ